VGWPPSADRALSSAAVVVADATDGVFCILDRSALLTPVQMNAIIHIGATIAHLRMDLILQLVITITPLT
jgi:hypothetical protein